MRSSKPLILKAQAMPAHFAVSDLPIGMKAEPFRFPSSATHGVVKSRS
jgi:hypothetical protein